MKKTVFFLLAILILNSFSFISFAQSELEIVIAAVKQKVQIPPQFNVFESSSQMSSGGTEWRLWWRTPDNDPTAVKAEISVIADTNGRIKRYYRFSDEYIKSDGEISFPVYDKSEAKVYTYRFISKVAPELLDKVILFEKPVVGEYNDLRTAKVSYCRIENGIPYYSNYLNFVVDLNSAAVIEYECVWDYKLNFPKNEGQIITPQAARRNYEQYSGVELRYRMKYDENGNKRAYLVYVPVNKDNVVDAVEGNVMPAYNDLGRGVMPEEHPVTPTQRVPLSEQEVLSLNSTENILTIKQAEEYIRGISYININKNYTLEASSFYKQDTRYVVYLEFANLPKKPLSELTDKERAMIEAGDYSYVRASLDAINMDIMSLYTYDKEARLLINAVDQNVAKKRVDSFLAEYLKNKYAGCRFSDIQYNNGDKLYTFTYKCVITGIPFEGNDIRITYSAMTGNISTIECNWQFNVSVESAKDIVDLNKAKNIMFDNAPFKLMYMNKGTQSDNFDKSEPEPTLVYGFDPYTPKNVLASTGEIVNDNGKLFRNIKYERISDIEGHYGEGYIKKLANNAIIKERGSFYPDNFITQREYLALLFLGTKGYDYNNDTDLYAAAIRLGLISAEERAPDEQITREDAVVLFIRIIELEKIAKIQDIYVLRFIDGGDILPENIGYVALAGGLGIVNGIEGYFNPKQSLTKAAAAVMVCNYLNRTP